MLVLSSTSQNQDWITDWRKSIMIYSITCLLIVPPLWQNHSISNSMRIKCSKLHFLQPCTNSFGDMNTFHSKRQWQRAKTSSREMYRVRILNLKDFQRESKILKIERKIQSILSNLPLNSMLLHPMGQFSLMKMNYYKWLTKSSNTSTWVEVKTTTKVFFRTWKYWWKIDHNLVTITWSNLISWKKSRLPSEAKLDQMTYWFKQNSSQYLLSSRSFANCLQIWLGQVTQRRVTNRCRLFYLRQSRFFRMTIN